MMLAENIKTVMSKATYLKIGEIAKQVRQKIPIPNQSLKKFVL